MKPIRVSLLFAGILVMSASTLSAQATRISCKDGSKPKVGHFACWGHGGLVRETTNAEPKPEHRAEKPAKKEKTAKAEKPKSKKHAASAKGHQKTDKKSAAKAAKKKKHAKQVAAK